MSPIPVGLEVLPAADRQQPLQQSSAVSTGAGCSGTLRGFIFTIGSAGILPSSPSQA